MNAHPFSCLPLLILLCPPMGLSAEVDSFQSGDWANAATWNGGVIPLPGNGDTANIGPGHTVIYTNAGPYAGLDGSNDFGTGKGGVININGGVVSQAMDGWWVRIGHKGDGTLNINDGRFHVSDGTAGGTNFMVGVEAGGNGIIHIGDGQGAAGSAVLNLRDRVDGSPNGGAYQLNLGASTNTAGTIHIYSDGLLEGDQRVWSNGNAIQNPHIRVGQASSDKLSSLTVHAGGQLRVRGNLEIGAEGGAQGLLSLTGAGARADMSDGEFTVGYSGTGSVVVENGAVFSRTHTPEKRSDMYLGRNGSGNGSLTIASGGQFLRGSGGNVGDMRVGYDGTGVLNVEEGGLYRNESGNWDWLGQNPNGKGTINVNGGTYEIAGVTNLRVGEQGTGTFNHNSGLTNVHTIQAGVGNGTGTITVRDGTFQVRGALFLGGDSTNTSGNGTAHMTQTGGSVSVGSALSVGIAANHSASYQLSGGTLTHAGSDMSIGESGSGLMVIGAGAALVDTSTGHFFVGRNNGSSGSLIVDGSLTKTGSANPIRVGNGNSDGHDNTNGTGFLGGLGSIQSAAGVQVGSMGTISAGTEGGIGTLHITGDLRFSAEGTLHADLNGVDMVADLLRVDGEVDLTDAFLTGTWDNGGHVGFHSRYWLILNEGADPIVGTFANASLSSPHASAYPDAGGFVNIGGQDFAIYYGADYASNAVKGGNDLMLSAIPEPASALLLLVAPLLGLRRRRA